MSWTEQKKAIDCLADISERMNQRYEQKQFGKRVCFVSRGVPFQVFKFPGQEALAVEYAENAEEAKAGRFEDGDLFYLKDFDSMEALLAAMLAEIDSTT